ncbi:transposase [Streptomyces canus]|uniref:transposase n=1 Tax=Streptomyces canus TaxID=58343 RepID=UPI00099E6260
MRAGIEAALSQNVRACGLRRNRYRVLPKTHIGHVLTALACNVTRIADWIAEPTRPPAGTKPLPCPLHRPQQTPARSASRGTGAHSAHSVRCCRERISVGFRARRRRVAVCPARCAAWRA